MGLPRSAQPEVRSRRAKSLCGRFAKTSREKSTVSNEAYATLSVLSAIARDSPDLFSTLVTDYYGRIKPSESIPI